MTEQAVTGPVDLAANPGAELSSLIRQNPSDPQRISDFLDRLREPDRIAAVRTLGRSDQRALWAAVDGFRPVTLDDVVPATVPLLTAVRHYGRNTLGVLTLFEKRFYRAADTDGAAPRELGGINVHPSRPLVGPGYFVAVEDTKRGEVLVDYRRVPDITPAGWVKVTGNEQGLARFVYGYMVDTLRRVSEHVTIGSAVRHGKDIGAYFVLCRQELS